MLRHSPYASFYKNLILNVLSLLFIKLLDANNLSAAQNDQYLVVKAEDIYRIQDVLYAYKVFSAKVLSACNSYLKNGTHRNHSSVNNHLLTINTIFPPRLLSVNTFQIPGGRQPRRDRRKTGVGIFQLFVRFFDNRWANTVNA